VESKFREFRELRDTVGVELLGYPRAPPAPLLFLWRTLEVVDTVNILLLYGNCLENI
jgi:hypothetical protein